MPNPKSFTARLARLEALERAQEAQRPLITPETPLAAVWWLVVALQRRGALWQSGGRWEYAGPQARAWVDGILADEPVGYDDLAALCALLDTRGGCVPPFWPEDLDDLQQWLDAGQLVDDAPHTRGLTFAEGAFVSPQDMYGGVRTDWNDLLNLASKEAPTLEALRAWLPAMRAQMEAINAQQA